MIIKLNIAIDDCELKFDGTEGEFQGYASKFNKTDLQNDTILPGAFKDAIKAKRKPSMFVNHNSFDVPVGDWTDLKEDKKGLLVRGVIDMNHRDGGTVHSALKRKAMDALSIGFRIPKGGSVIDDEETFHRTISKVDLKEISIVNFPADEGARILAVKSEIETINSLKDAELFLRDAEIFSRATAIAFVSRISALIQSDSETRLKDEIAKLHKELQSKNVTDRLVEFLNNIHVKN